MFSPSSTGIIKDYPFGGDKQMQTTTVVCLRDFSLILLKEEILHQLRLVVYPIMCRVLAPSQVCFSQISAINSIYLHER